MAHPRSAAVDSALRGELVEIFASAEPGVRPVRPDVPARAIRHLDLECILFDIYGTLFSSASGDVGTSQASSNDADFAAALRNAGLELLDDTAPRKARECYFEEIARRHRSARARGIDWPEVEIDAVWATVIDELAAQEIVASGEASDPSATAMRAAAWYEALSNAVSPMPGALSAIRALSASGKLLGIVSNAQFYTPLLFPAHFGTDHTAMGFREELCAWSYRVGRAKPSTGLFSVVLERLSQDFGVRGNSVLYVGNDMLNDIWTAHEAGCRTALFAGDAKSLRLRENDPRCAGLAPDLVLSTHEDLLEAIGGPSARRAKEKAE